MSFHADEEFDRVCLLAAKFVGTTVEGSNFEAAITKGFTVHCWLLLDLGYVLQIRLERKAFEAAVDPAETIQIHLWKQCRQRQD